jgi:hypothetical protein
MAFYTRPELMASSYFHIWYNGKPEGRSDRARRLLYSITRDIELRGHERHESDAPIVIIYI